MAIVRARGSRPRCAQTSCRYAIPALTSSGRGRVGCQPSPRATALAADPAGIGSAYLERARTVVGDAARFIDKLPLNFFYVGFLRRALPNARIVCIRRHPLDSCLSNYKQIFPMDDRYFDYVYDLAWAAEKFVLFDRMLAQRRLSLHADAE